MIRKLVFLLIFVLAGSSAIGPLPTQAQDNTTEIGIAPSNQNALELVGQIDQAVFNLTTYGYVTYANGIVPDLLFVEGTPALFRNENTARLTFYGTGTSQSRSVHQNIFSSVVTATITFYWNDIPANLSFDNPDSFQAGVPIATITARLQSILNVQEPNVGVLMAFGDTTQDSATPFTVNQQSYQFGHVGLAQRYTFFGQGFRSSEEPLAAHYLFAANAVNP